MTQSKKKEAAQDSGGPAFDDVLKRMLSAPPMPKVKAKPAAKPAQPKPAK
jgi:hypothetical protein